MSSATINTELAAVPATSAEDDRATAGIVYAYTASAAFWLLVGSAYGTLAACKLVWPDLLPFEWLSFGRIRPIHTASVLLGWLSVGLTGIAYLVVYRTARRALFSNALAHAGLWLLNLALARRPRHPLARHDPRPGRIPRMAHPHRRGVRGRLAASTAPTSS